MADPSPHEGHRARLRARFAKAGLEGFGEHEVVELLLTLVIPRRDVKPIAKALLQEFGNLKGIFEAEPNALQRVSGIGGTTPVNLRILREVYALSLQQAAEQGPVLNSVDKLIAFWTSRLGGLRYEVFEVAYLDKAHRLLKDGVQRLEEGTIDRAVVYPRKVMENALQRSAKSVVLAHNHPTGRCEPSDQDVQLTRAIEDAARPLEITILDHLILAGNNAFSFRRIQLLQAR